MLLALCLQYTNLVQGSIDPLSTSQTHTNTQRNMIRFENNGTLHK